MRQLKPNGKRVLIRQAASKTMTESGLHIPEKAQEQMFEGKVLATGPETVTYTEGATVLFSKYAGTVVELNGEKLLLVTEEEILGELVD